MRKTQHKILGIYNKDARDISNHMCGKVIQTTITSPPYFDMKDYGTENQIGFGQTYEEYLNDLKIVFKGVFKITKDDGTLWIIIDTIKKNDETILLPFDLSTKLKEIGWKLQEIIIWKKDKTVPWASSGFVQRKFEFILLFSKTNQYKCHRDITREYDTKHLKQWWVKYPERYNPKGKAMDDVWEYPIPTQGSWGDQYIKHFCPLPMDMVGNMIQLTTNEQDIVLDPFSGSGAVLSQAAYMSRKYVGFELNKDYISMFKHYLKNTIIEGQKKYKAFQSDHYQQDNFEETIIRLRCLKYAKLIYQKIGKKDRANLKYIFVEDSGVSNEKFKLKKVKYLVSIVDVGVVRELRQKIDKLVSKPPFSKFGIEPEITIEIPTKTSRTPHQLFGYKYNNTHKTIGNVTIEHIPDNVKIISNIKMDINENDYK
jgi:DNA modification methylase